MGFGRTVVLEAEAPAISAALVPTGWDPATLSWKTAPVPADPRETVSGAVAAQRLQQLQDGDLELPGASDFDQRLTETRRIFYAERVVQGCTPAGPAPEAAVTAGSLRAAQAARAAQAP